MSNLKRLIQFIRPHLPRMAGAVVAMIGVAAANVAIILMLKPIFDDALQPDAVLGDAGRLAAVIVLLFLALGIARYVSAYLMGSVGYAVVRDLRVDLYRHLQFLPLKYHHQRSVGGLMSRVTSDVLAVQEAITRVLVDLLREGLTLIGYVGMMIFYDWLLALVILTLGPLVVSLIDRLGRRIRKVSRETQRGLGTISSLLQETLTGIRVVKAFCMERAEIEKFRRAAERLFRHSLRAERLSAIGPPLMELIGAVALAGVLVYGSWRIGRGEMTAGELATFLAAAFATYAPLRRLSAANVRIQAAASAADRLYEILDEPLEAIPGALDPILATTAPSRARVRRADAVAAGSSREMPAIVQGIRFHDVRFAYEDEEEGESKQVLHGIDLAIPAGRAVALVGPSGAGKSTIANLIPRFFEPTDGRVTIDGIDLREIPLDDLRGEIAMVTQETILFNDSVRNNIAYCQPDVSHEAVERAARAAFAHDFVVDLTEGYDTVLGEQGVRLSGGQRQRIAIARALLKNAPILILDEATSNLDVRSDRLVQEALSNLVEGRTTLIIAHRLSTIRDADLIAVIEDGQVVEAGTHEELLARMGPYQRLYSMHYAGASEAGFSIEG